MSDEAVARIEEAIGHIRDRLQIMEAVWLRMNDKQVAIEATQQRILLELSAANAEAVLEMEEAPLPEAKIPIE